MDFANLHLQSCDCGLVWTRAELDRGLSYRDVVSQFPIPTGLDEKQLWE